MMFAGGWPRLSERVPLQCKRSQRFGHTQRNCGYAPRCVACGAPKSPVDAVPRGISLCYGCGGNHTANYRGSVKWQEWRRLLQSKCPNAVERALTQANRPLLKLRWSVPQPSRWTWARGGITSAGGGGRVVKFTTTPSTNSHPNPPPQSVTEAHEKPIVTATRETAKHKKPQFKTTSPSKRTSGMSNKKAEASVKTAAATPTIPSLVVHTLSPTSPLEEISDLLDHLPLHACVELTHRLLTSITSLPTETARPRAFMKTVILLYQNIAARRGRTELCKALRLACWNANGVSCRKLVLVHSLSQHGVDICLLIQPFLNPGQAFRFANYVCHRTDKSTAGGGTAILVRRGIVHHSVPVPGLTHLEATAIQVILDGKLV